MVAIYLGGVDGDNAITIPIAHGSLRVGTVEVGERGFAYDGSAFSSVRAEKRALKGRTTPLSPAEADAWLALLSGEGVSATWDGETTYTDQGHVAVESVGASIATANGYDGTNCLELSAGATKKISFAVQSLWPYTLIVRRKNGAGAWVHYVQTSTGKRYEDRFETSDGSYAWYTYTAGLLTLKGDASNVVRYDDLLLLPGIVTAAMVANWPDAPSVTPRPNVLVYSSEVAWLQEGLTMLGTVKEDSQIVLAGSNVMAHVLEFELREV